MTPNDKQIVQSLVAVAWADGKVDEPEQGVIDGLLWAFEASDEDETELREWAKEKRTLADMPLDGLSSEDKESLLAHAALVTHADGEQSAAEKELLDQIIEKLDFDADRARTVLESARKRAEKFASKLG